jgi:hypothetical protein
MSTLSLVMDTLQSAVALPTTTAFSVSFWRILWGILVYAFIIVVKMAIIMALFNNTIPRITSGAINKITMTDALLMSLLLSFII